MASMAGSLFRGCDASFSVSTFAEAVVSNFEDTCCLGTSQIRCLQCLSSTPLIIRVRDVSLSLDCDHWFKFMKRPLILTVDLVSEPSAVDVYWTWSDGQDLILLGLIKGRVFPFFFFFHFSAFHCSSTFHFYSQSLCSYSLLPSVLLLWRMYDRAVAAPPPTCPFFHKLWFLLPTRYVSASASFSFSLWMCQLFSFLNIV